MALDAEERSHSSLLERPRLFAVRSRAFGDKDETTAVPATDSVRVRGPAPQERLRGTRFFVDFLPGHEDNPAEHDRKTEDELRRRLRRQDALVAAIALLLLAVAALGVTYLYWDYGRPFESTDDAFIAGRQFPMVARAIATR
jgi:membrane fusion protein, multidrug efflux system